LPFTSLLALTSTLLLAITLQLVTFKSYVDTYTCSMVVAVTNIFLQAGGAILFVVAMLGWYITFVIMAAEMRLGINFPVGDLSHFWPSTDVELTEIEKQA
jgi:hypothetical protein